MGHRIERINSVIREEISELIQRQVKDPRLDTLISITAVETAGDLKHAKVFVSQIGVNPEKSKVLEGLASASGFFRSELSRRLKMRYVPELHFRWDDSIERADRITRLINNVTQDSNTEK